MKKLMFAAAALLSASMLMAQEIAEDSAVQGYDGGVQALEEAQAMEEPLEGAESAAALLEEKMAKRGWKLGEWDSDNGRIIVTVSDEFVMADPKSNPEKLFILREAAIKRAILKAKAEVIETINTEMSASEKLDVPGSDINKKLGAEYEKIKLAMMEQAEALASLIEETDQAEAEVLRGTTVGQRLDDMMVAIIKKLDADYNANKWDEAAKARFETLKQQRDAASAEYKALLSKAESFQETLQNRQESEVETLAKMPLYGTTVLMQTESWDADGGRYEVAVALVWSKVLERSARAIATGENFKCKIKDSATSVREWLDKQNLATFLGPRQYVDNKGNRWFLAATARPMEKKWPSAKRNKMKGLAEMFAKQMAAFCIYGDVESHKKALQIVEERGDGETESEYLTAEDIAQKLTAAFNKKTIRGLQKLKTKEVVHPVTGGRIYVAVYGLNAANASDAIEVEKINYATKVMDNQHQSIERGRKAGYEAAVKASENRAEDFEKGKHEAKTAVDNEVKTRKKVDTEHKGTAVKIKKSSANDEPKKNSSGVFSGDVDVDDDF